MPGGGGCDSKGAQFSAQMKNYGWRPHLSKLELRAEHRAEQNKLEFQQAINRLNRMRNDLTLLLYCRSIELSDAIVTLIRHIIRHIEKLYHQAGGVLAFYGGGLSVATVCPSGALSEPSRGPPSFVALLEKANKMIDDVISQTQKMSPKEAEDLVAIVQTPQKKTSGWKKAVAYGMTILTLGLYAPTTTDAGGIGSTPQGGKVIYMAPGANMGQINNGGMTVMKGGIGQANGNIITKSIEQDNISPDTLRKLKENSNSYSSEKKPAFNYKTAKQVQDAINNAYHKHEYQKMVDLSDYGINNKDKLKATPKQIEAMKHGKELGEYYKKTGVN